MTPNTQIRVRLLSALSGSALLWAVMALGCGSQEGGRGEPPTGSGGAASGAAGAPPGGARASPDAIGGAAGAACESDCSTPTAGACMGCVAVSTAIGNMCDPLDPEFEGKPVLWDCDEARRLSADSLTPEVTGLVAEVEATCAATPFSYPAFCCPRDFKVECLPRCEQPPDVGPCDAALTAFAFNPASYSCEAFTYGGCEGNSNRFDTAEACVLECPVPGQGEADPADASMYFADTICTPAEVVPATLLPRLAIGRDTPGHDDIELRLEAGIPSIGADLLAEPMASLYHRIRSEPPTWAENYAAVAGTVRFTRYELPDTFFVMTSESMPVDVAGEYDIEFERVGRLSGSFVIAEAGTSGAICEPEEPD